jgi:hypothetical protein
MHKIRKKPKINEKNKKEESSQDSLSLPLTERTSRIYQKYVLGRNI